jgi:hypothetical protein
LRDGITEKNERAMVLLHPPGPRAPALRPGFLKPIRALDRAGARKTVIGRGNLEMRVGLRRWGGLRKKVECEQDRNKQKRQAGHDFHNWIGECSMNQRRTPPARMMPFICHSVIIPDENEKPKFAEGLATNPPLFSAPSILLKSA